MVDAVGPEQTNIIPLDILLVEDNEADIKIAMRAFKQASLQNNLHAVHDGQECLDFLYHRGKYQDTQQYPRPDIILLDISMPKVDGFGVLKSLKQDPEYKFIPVIVLTGSKNEQDVMKSYVLGANSFIQKSVAYEEFVKIIEGFNLYWNVINKLPGGKK